MATAFLAKNATLMPLFVAVGLGIGGGVGFGMHYLIHSPDVAFVNRKTNPRPWQNVQADENTKLFSFNKDFWQSRSVLHDPRLAFLEAKPEKERTLHEQAMVDRAKELRRLDRELTHHN